jgi:hypothetical protein
MPKAALPCAMRASDGEIAAQGFALRKAVSRMGIQPAPGTPGPEQDSSHPQEDESTRGDKFRSG